MTNPTSVPVTKVPLYEIPSGKLARFSLSIYGNISTADLPYIIGQIFETRNWFGIYCTNPSVIKPVEPVDLAPPQTTRDVLPKRTRDEITHRSTPIKASIWR